MAEELTKERAEIINLEQRLREAEDQRDYYRAEITNLKRSLREAEEQRDYYLSSYAKLVNVRWPIPTRPTPHK